MLFDRRATSTKTRIETGSCLFCCNWKLLNRRATSTKTRIETLYFPCVLLPLPYRRATSTKTRIETKRSAYCRAERRWDRRATSTKTRIETWCWGCKTMRKCYRRATSTKTRIETKLLFCFCSSRFSIAGRHPLKQGLKPYYSYESNIFRSGGIYSVDSFKMIDVPCHNLGDSNRQTGCSDQAIIQFNLQTSSDKFRISAPPPPTTIQQSSVIPPLC